jgi:SAM-dependent methyltransferase
VALEARRILRPGGVLLFSAYTFDPAKQIPEPMRHDLERERIHAGIPEPYTRAYLRSLLALARFETPADFEAARDEGSGYGVFAARRP